jgi:hypothetical protein
MLHSNSPKFPFAYYEALHSIRESRNLLEYFVRVSWTELTLWEKQKSIEVGREFALKRPPSAITSLHSEERRQPWLPKKSTYPLDALQKTVLI